MKIEKKAEDCINFGEVRCGDVFCDDNGCYYMKLIDGGRYAAVNLATGVSEGFSYYELVTPIPNAKIVI